MKSNSVNNGAEKKRGGGKPGHTGNGRQSLSTEQADRVEEVNVGSSCPNCGSDDLAYVGRRERTVIEYIIKREKVVYQLERNRCNGCGTIIQAK
ncbi:MAG: hypothetical protein JW704_10105, partial [Anaerolineaceae bacterium]|nr:hypothetical protein [Anaerolineaceae bacterium]